MFNGSSSFFSVTTVLFILVNTPCFGAKLPKRNPLVPISSFYFSSPIYIPILARLRNNTKIVSLMNKAQNPQKDPKQQNKSPLTENETKEVQLAIQEIYFKTVDLVKAKMQEICDACKCIIHFETETDIQLAPGFPFPIKFECKPTKNLTKEEAEYIEYYFITLSQIQEGFKSIMETIAK